MEYNLMNFKKPQTLKIEVKKNSKWKGQPKNSRIILCKAKPGFPQKDQIVYNHFKGNYILGKETQLPGNKRPERE